MIIFFFILADTVLGIFLFIYFYYIDHTHPASFITHTDRETENLLYLCWVSQYSTGWVPRVLEHQTCGCDSLKLVLF